MPDAAGTPMSNKRFTWHRERARQLQLLRLQQEEAKLLRKPARGVIYRKPAPKPETTGGDDAA
jgi:hypothetical protein